LVSLQTTDSPVRRQLFTLDESMLRTLIERNYFDVDLDEYTDESVEDMDS